MNAIKEQIVDNDFLTPLIHFKDVWHEGRYHHFTPDDLYALLILQKNVSKKVSYDRAFRGWKSSPFIHEKRSTGRAFYSWLNRHKLSIIWKESDFNINPILTSPLAPKHDENDELAASHSFVIRPQMVNGKKVKLYVQDRDMIKLLSLHIGDDVPLEDLTRNYIAQRIKWEKSLIQAPTFLDWVIAIGKRPLIREGELGFFPQVCFSSS